MLFLFHQLKQKITDFGRLLLDVLNYFPERFLRLMKHLNKGIQSVKELSEWQLSKVFFWCLEVFILLLDLLGLSEFYEGISAFLKWSTRPLTPDELHLAQSIYGSTIRWERVRIDERAWLGPRTFRLCYVSGFLINSWGPMPSSIFIHELMHVWQYQQIGLVYIPRALRAFHSIENYNYGGWLSLEMVKQKGGSLWDFNLEQQADIIADYYRIRSGERPHWGNAGVPQLEVYQYFVDQLEHQL